MNKRYLAILFLAGFFRLQAACAETRFLVDTLPTIVCPSDTVLGVFSGSCTAPLNYNVIANDDLLSYTVTQTSGLPSGSGFPIGKTVNTYLVTDLGGNTASCSFSVTVKDYDPPIALCKTSLTVLVETDDPNDCYEANGISQFGGVKWVKIGLFNNGSYDPCSSLKFTLSRVAPYSTFVQSLNQTNGHPPCNDVFPDFPSEFERAISEQDSIKFYCKEAGTTQDVALKVYQLDPSGQISLGQDGLPMVNQCIVQVKVKDGIPPSCVPPPPVNVTCENFDPTLQSYGTPQVSDNCCIGSQQYSVNYNLFDTICNKGTIVRKWSLVDCTGASGQCTQRIFINYVQNYFIRFPDDTLVTACNTSGIYGKPAIFGDECELIGTSYEDEYFGLPPVDACYVFSRTWTVINWCKYNPDLPLIDVPNPQPSSLASDPLNKPGPVISACGTAGPWAPTISKINPSDTATTNFCIFWNATVNGFRYKQLIRVKDSAPPSFIDCPGTGLVYNDTTQNDPNFWNFSVTQQDLAEQPIDLSTSASDNCSGGNVELSFRVWLDLDGDDVPETVIQSNTPPPADTVYYNNAQNPGFQGGTPVAFDHRPVPQNQKWRFDIQQTSHQGYRSAALRWHNAQAPDVYVIPALPRGTHKIQWFAKDGCGNVDTCEYTFTLKGGMLDCSPPPTVNISCEAFDPSLLAYGTAAFSGGCAPVNASVSNSYTQFDTICNRGTIIRHFNASDACGNTSQCIQKIVVNYHQDYYIKFPNDVIVTNCDGLGNYGEPLFYGEDCELLGVSYEDIPIDIIPDACYKLERAWTVINWCTYNPNVGVIDIPNPNPNPITNHPSNLPGPTVSACGTPAPWAPTVVKVNPTDPNPTNYCNFWNAAANGYRYKQFIKIIDTEGPEFINCNPSIGNIPDPGANDAQLWNNVFAPNQGNVDLAEAAVTIGVIASDACTGSNVNLQYLLYLDLDANGQAETVINSAVVGPGGLGWNNVLYNNVNTPGGTPTAFDQRAVPDVQKYGFAIRRQLVGTDQVSASVAWNTQLAPNTYVLPQLPNGKHHIRWIAMDGCGNQTICDQAFSIGDTTLVGAHEPGETAGFSLLQNEPNPFSDNTSVRFLLPESMPAELSIYDLSGKLLYRNSDYFPSGWNSVLLEKNLLGNAGVCFYRLKAGRFSAWRKMTLIK